ncbi:MAG: hypothetical protein ACJA1A_002100 [Saprospiraceae bacterium]|jgi:hypothetical protein
MSIRFNFGYGWINYEIGQGNGVVINEISVPAKEKLLHKNNFFSLFCFQVFHLLSDLLNKLL